MSENVHLTLPTWVGGSMTIRFIYLVNDTSFRLTEYPNKEPAIPLYLGADLFNKTDIRTENHPRYHAKFAKKGLATKLHFPSVYRVSGLRLSTSNNSLWFYSVEGLFRVAFELYNKHDQLSILDNFQNIWKSHIEDGPLEMVYNLSGQLDFTAISTEQRTQIPKSLQEIQSPKVPKEKAKDHNYCSNAQESLVDTASNLDSSASFHQQIQKLNNKLPHIQPEQLNTVVMFLDFIESYIQGNLNENGITEVVMALLQVKQWDCVYSSPLLHSVGCWLGKQFHKANSNISQKVEGFKVHHIDRISDLPPAEELSKELFPEAMLSLLLYWMGLSEDSSLEKRHSEYPILLLILEFANHNLITGVAHVLYSSLICK